MLQDLELLKEEAETRIDRLTLENTFQKKEKALEGGVICEVRTKKDEEIEDLRILANNLRVLVTLLTL